MYITFGQKTVAMVSGLLIVCAGTFVYLDPMELGLLGSNHLAVASPSVAKESPVVNLKGEMTTTQFLKKDMLKAPSAMKSVTSSEKAVILNIIKLSTPDEMAAVMRSKKSESLSIFKPTSINPNHKINTPYPPSMDVRHCLGETTPQRIAKCAGEL